MENNNYLANLKKEAEDAIAQVVSAANRHARSGIIKACKKTASEKINRYNFELEKATYREWGSGDPVKTAILNNRIEGAIKVKYDVDDKTDAMEAKILYDDDYHVSLPTLQTVVGADKFHDADWFDKLQKIAFIIAGGVCKKIEDSSFEYEIAESAKAFNFPDGIDPYTESGMFYAFQSVIDAICFIPDENGKNKIYAIHEMPDGSLSCPAFAVNREAFTKHGKADNTIAFTNLTKLSQYVCDAMHCIMCENGIFSVEAEK